MAEAIKVLGQADGTAAVGTYANLYACPTSTSTVVSTIAVCNITASAQTYRVGIGTASTTLSNLEHLVYGATVPANDSVFLTLGVTLTPTQKFLNYSSSNASVVFSAFGVETT